jgi:hypothetical protein
MRNSASQVVEPAESVHLIPDKCKREMVKNHMHNHVYYIIAVLQ